MKRKILLFCISLCLAAGLLPAVVFANDSRAEDPVYLDLSDGAITITAGGYKQPATGTETSHTGPFVITQTEATTNNTITVESGHAAITIDGLLVEAVDEPAIDVKAGAALQLTVQNANVLTGGNGFAAICVEPAYDGDWNYDQANSATLTVSGDGNLTVTGGDGTQDDSFGGGAGIGGNGQDIPGNGVDFGSVIITSQYTGTIEAVGGNTSASSFGGGAGIGGGGFNMDHYPWGHVAGQIEVQNGTIIAVSNGNGAGIGGGGGQGYDTATSAIAIQLNGGTIHAAGGTLAAGIGGGGICDGGFITISNAKVTAEAGSNDGSMGAAGIGGGNDASVSQVHISDGAQVTATASGGGAGIGGGTNTSYSNLHYGDKDGIVTPERTGSIAISGEGTMVNAVGGTGVNDSGYYGGAGIGSGYPTANNARSVAFQIAITEGASVRAYGGYHAQAIGYGYRPTDYIGYGITLVLDDTIFLWAQNADYYQPALVANTTLDADRTPVSYSSENDIFLTHYVDSDKEATSAHSDEVKGYLQQPAAAADDVFNWTYDENANTVSIGPMTVIDNVSNLQGNWATLCKVKPDEPMTISLADLIIYVGGDGYESVITDKNGDIVKTKSDGLPEPGFYITLPEEVETDLKEALGYASNQPLDLSDYLSFVYDDGNGNTRSWTLERYDAKEGNTSMAHGKYVYRIVPGENQDPVRLQFTDENKNTTISDEFEIELHDQYQVYDMSIYPGALNTDELQAVVSYPDGTELELNMTMEAAKLIIRGVVDEEDPTTSLVTTTPDSPVDRITAQVSKDTLFYINESKLEVENWDAVKLLVDHIVPQAQDILLERALNEYAAYLNEDFHYEFYYLDLVDTSNGNVWVTADKPVTIYWPYPKGTDQNTEFFIVHYHDLNRQYDEDITEKEYETSLYTSDQARDYTLENTEQGIKITINSFSPFALFWETEDKTPADPDISHPSDTADPSKPSDHIDPTEQNDVDHLSKDEADPQTSASVDRTVWAVLGAAGCMGAFLSMRKKYDHK